MAGLHARRVEAGLRRRAVALRVAATAGLTVAGLVVAAGGWTVATSPAVAVAPGDRVAVTDLLRQDAPDAAAATADGSRREQERASRAQRPTPAAGLPETSAQARAWLAADVTHQADVAARTDAAEAELQAVQEAERAAARQEVDRLVQEATRRLAEEEIAERLVEETTARIDAEQEAQRRATEEVERAVAAAVAAAEQRAADQQAADQQAADQQAAAQQAADQQAADQQAAAVGRAGQQPPSPQGSGGGSDPRSNRAVAQSLLGGYGWDVEQWACLDQLWQKESGWRHTADNPSSSAYGIPQALPGRKMASAGADWETNPVTQVRWGLGYIEDRYGTPCAAWQHSVDNNWY